MNSKKIKTVIAVTLLIFGASLLIYQSAKSMAVYYYTVDELMTKIKSKNLSTKIIRVSGMVQPKTLEIDSVNNKVTFRLQGSDNSIKILFSGTIPNTLCEKKHVLVEGYLVKPETFEASKIITKCASKYKVKLKTK